jgi:hypothetical protein
MDWQGVGAVIGGVGAMFGGVRRFSGKGERMRSRIDRDLHLRDKLPADTTGRDALERHIDDSVANLVAFERDQDQRRTDPYGLIWMVIFVGLAIGAAATALRTHYHWWLDLLLWLVAGFLVVLTLIGATVTFRQPPKDKGA